MTEKSNKKEEGIPPIGAGLLGGGIGALAGGVIGYNKGYADGYQEGYKDGEKECKKEILERAEILYKAEILRKDKNRYKSNLNKKVPKHIKAIYAEACNCFIDNQTRATCIMAGVAVELSLKYIYEKSTGEKADEKTDFNYLLNWAHKNGVLNKDDKFYGHAIRVVENMYKHDYKDVNKFDPLPMLMSSIRIINNIFS